MKSIVFLAAPQKLLTNSLKICRKLIVIARIKQIKNRDFTIIASNCTGTLPYRFLNIPYSSPTINLYFMAPDYLRFVKRLDYYLSLPLSFTPRSHYAQGERVHKESGRYPIGVLDDIEIHFMHYNSEEDAAAKWNRRKQRINRDKLVFAFTDKDLCTQELLEEFDALPYPNKYVFTANHHPEILNSIHVEHYQGLPEMGDAYTNYDTLTHVNFSKLLDTMLEASAESLPDSPLQATHSPVVDASNVLCAVPAKTKGTATVEAALSTENASVAPALRV